MTAIKMNSCQRIVSPDVTKEDRQTPQADSTGDPSQDEADLLSSPTAHILDSKHEANSRRMSLQEISPIPSPSQCQYGSGIRATGYGSVPCMSLGSESVYYPHHHSAAGRIGGGSPFLPASAPSPLLPNVNQGLSFSSHMTACRLAAQPSPDGSLRQSSMSSSPTSSSSSSGYALRPSHGHGHHVALSSCTYMQSPQSSYASHHIAANMMNFP